MIHPLLTKDHRILGSMLGSAILNEAAQVLVLGTYWDYKGRRG